MYKFVRIVNTKQRGDMGVWYLVPANDDQIHEHYKLYCQPLWMAAQRHQMKIWRMLCEDWRKDNPTPSFWSEDDYRDTEKYYKRVDGSSDSFNSYNAEGEMTSFFTKTVNALSKMIENYSRTTMYGRAISGVKLMNGCEDERISRSRKTPLYLPEANIMVFIMNETNPEYKIVETAESDKLLYPVLKKPTLEDVRLLTWDGGIHWYAKVNNLDVVWEGEQKWLTKDEAMKAAEKFINDTWK